MARARSSRILVVGASGYFGSLLVEDLLRHTDANVWVGARGHDGMEKLLRRFGPVLSQRLTPCVCDLAQPASAHMKAGRSMGPSISPLAVMAVSPAS